MNPEQIGLARQALGLTGGRRISYRNYFCADPGHSAYDNWFAMVESGMAVRRDQVGGGHIFHLTPAGARSTLKPGERLDPEDFPSTLSSGERRD